jgi:ribulose-5-phosphate 4-epimerase/fuculose-1-phosphate aldolase
MPDALSALRDELATANRILAMEGVIDAFGHISVRHPTNPDRYLITKYQAAELVQREDVVELTLDSEPVGDKNVRLFSEVPIHGCIYQARPDVMSVCHHHADSIMPFAISGAEFLPVFHIGASSGEKIPFWDSRDDFGDTKLVVTRPEEARSLARALGPHWMVIMRRHGATVVGKSLRETVFRSVYTAKNAELQLRARMLGSMGPLTTGEIRKAGDHVTGERSMGRAWQYWSYRLARYEKLSPPPPKPPQDHPAAVAAQASRVVKPAAKKEAAKPAKVKSRGKRR